jgi:beta-glucanase (GH16 family)
MRSRLGILGLLRRRFAQRGQRPNRPVRRRSVGVEQLEPRLQPSATPIVNDDFNLPVGSQPSNSTWSAFNATDPNNANVVYTNSASTLRVVNDSGALDGKALAMSLIPDPTNPGKFDSAEIRTSVDPVAGNLLYGRIEARIKLPGGPNGQGDGIWPAFWMLGSNIDQVGWPACGEMDIMENKGGTPGEIQGTIHGPGYQDVGLTTKYDLPAGQAFYSGYHIFAVDWAPNSVQFSVDGTVYASLTPSSMPAGGVWAFNHPFFIVLDVAEGGPFAGPADPNSTYPQTMYVDYVRAFAEAPPVINLYALPNETNISSLVIAGQTDPGNTVSINGVAIPHANMDSRGAFADTVGLVSGNNTLSVTITDPSGGQVASATRTIVYEPTLSTSDRELLYVDAVSPALNGTVVIDVRNNEILGILPGKHVRGISPTHSEIYMDDDTVVSTSTNQELRVLPFRQPIPANGFLVSPTGTRLYSQNEVADVASNTLLSPPPVNITAGASWAGPIPGGPAFSADGSGIFYGTYNIDRIDTASNQVTHTGAGGLYLSDIALSPDGKFLLVSEYAYAAGDLKIYDATSYSLLGTVGGLGDFAGKISFVDPDVVAIGSAGNPAYGGGGVTFIDLNKRAIIQRVSKPLADDLTASPAGNEVFVTAGDNLGVDDLVRGTDGKFALSKSFFLGIDRFVTAYGGPQNDQIGPLVLKPAANSPPVLDPIGNQAVAAQQTLSFRAIASDTDGDQLSFSLAGAPAGAAIDPVTGAFTWTPAAPGSYTFTVQVTDNGSPPLSAQQTVTVTVNAPPVLDPISNKAIAQGTTLTFTAHATDPDGDQLSFSLANAPAGAAIDPVTGAFTWTPAAPGSYTFTVQVTDNSSPPLSAQQTVTVTVNAPPVLDPISNKAVALGTALTFTAHASDPDGDQLLFALANAPAGAAIDAVGVFTWTPTAPGSYTFTVEATDNGSPPLSTQQTVTVTVNAPPVLDLIGNKTVNVGTPLTFIAHASDPDGDQLSFALANAPAGATIDPATGVFTWTPTAAQGPGNYTFTVQATDRGSPPLSDQQTITVRAVNAPPVLDPIGNFVLAEGATLTFAAHATDPDGDQLSFALINAPAGASINPATGAFTWTPTAPGNSAFTVQVTDNGSPRLNAQQTVTVMVNTTPVLDLIGNKAVDEGTALTFTAYATDPDRDQLSFGLAGAPAGASINPATGAFTWTPTAPGNYTFTVRVTDNGSPPLSAQQTITVTVSPLVGDISAFVSVQRDKPRKHGSHFGQTITLQNNSRLTLSGPLTLRLLGIPKRLKVRGKSGISGVSRQGTTVSLVVTLPGGSLPPDATLKLLLDFAGHVPAYTTEVVAG